MNDGWLLTDDYMPPPENEEEDEEEDEENESVRIFTAEDARIELTRLSKLEPRVVVLEEPKEDICFKIGIGGEWAGMLAIESEMEYGEERQQMWLAMPEKTIAPNSIDFLYWAQPCRLMPNELFPVAEFIELVAEYIESGTFPEWLDWRDYGLQHLR